jgi:hypothetical protein
MPPQELDITAGDYGFTWQFNLANYDGTPFDLSAALSASFKIQLQTSETVLSGSVNISTNPTQGVALYMVGRNDFPEVGRYNCEIVVDFPGIVVTFPGITVVAGPELPI